MELEGFYTNVVEQDENTTITEYRAEGHPEWKCLSVKSTRDGDIIINLLENGEPPQISPGERTASPENNELIMSRLLKAMAVYHFNAHWIEDGYTTIDTEMISRGFEVGRCSDGKLIWVKTVGGITTMVTRGNSNSLLSSHSNEALFTVKGPSGTQLNGLAFDVKSLLRFIDGNNHLQLYNPYHDVNIGGIYHSESHTKH